MTTGEYIKTIRKQKKVTQEELASRIGTGHSVISKYENGQIEPTIGVLYRIADALQISREAFLTDIFDNELKAVFITHPELEAKFYNQPPDYGFDLDSLIEQSKKAIKDGDPEKAIKFLTLLKQVLPSNYSNLVVYQDLQEVVRKSTEKKLLKAFYDLNDEGQKVAADVVEGIARIEKYQHEYGRSREDVPLVKNSFESPHPDNGTEEKK